MKLEVVSMIKVNGKWIQQEDIPQEELRRLLETKMDETMRNIGFARIKTA